LDPQTPQTSAQPGVNPLLAHLNDTDESHASTRVDFMHPGTIVHPQVNAPVEIDSTHNLTPDTPMADSKLAVHDLSPGPAATAKAEPPAPVKSAASMPENSAPLDETTPVAAAAPLVVDAPAGPAPAATEPVIAEATKKDAQPPASEPPVAPPPPAAAPPAPKSPRNRRPLWIVLIIVLLLGLAGGGAYYWFKIRKTDQSPASQPVENQTVTVSPEAPTSLEQKNADGQTLASGDATKNPVELNFSLSTSANSGTLQPQVEIQPIGTEFTGQSNYQGADTGVTSGSVAGVVTAKDLKDGAYHWQARFVAGSTAGNWVSYGSNEESAADFVIDSTAPATAKVTTVGGKSASSGTVTTTNNQPTFNGTAEAGSTVSISIAPDSLSATATTAADGSWTLSLNQQLANGEHTVTITTTDTAGNSQTSTLTLSINTGTTATTTVAPTGDNPWLPVVIGLMGMIFAASGLILATRRGQPQV
jgi:hypothetical protein